MAINEVHIREGLLVRRFGVAKAILETFEKGIYVNDAANRKAGIVGQHYGAEEKLHEEKPKSKWAEVDPVLRAKLINRTSYNKHTDLNGDFTESRQLLHGNIIKKITDVKPQAKPHAILLLGGGASGKSHVWKTMVKPDLKNGEQYAYLNNDDIKEELPEYKRYQAVDAPSAAARVHDESRAITKMVLRNLKNSKKNFVYDATLNDYDKALALAKELKGLGYKVEMVGVIVDEKTARTNAKLRYERSGRAVPDYILTSAQKGARRTFYKLEKYNRAEFSNMTLYNNDGSLENKPPLKIYENGKQLDEEKYAMVKQYH